MELVGSVAVKLVMEESDWHQCNQEPRRLLVLQLTASNHQRPSAVLASEWGLTPTSTSLTYGQCVVSWHEETTAGACEADMVKLPQTHRGSYVYFLIMSLTNILRISNNIRWPKQPRTFSLFPTGKDREDEALMHKELERCYSLRIKPLKESKDSGNRLSHTSHEIHLRNLPSAFQHVTLRQLTLSLTLTILISDWPRGSYDAASSS